jgi:diaminohydroxyphosphoribosylaminopyrimidine deaminase/5-amino-6-(5-phosphoribosylamino)uracil reductase
MHDEHWMQRCLDLAGRGAGATSPNPLVGSVIVKNGKKLSEGYHRQYGGPHAEINAIELVKDKNTLKGATIYVNLEPCCHHGNTPPCVDEILRYGFSRVVIGGIDPNPLVNGKSISLLRKHGVRCDIGILNTESERINEKYRKYISTDLPFVALKAAQTHDGFIARLDGSSKWITNALSRHFVHTLRSEYDAVMVGAGTVAIDDPRLTVRSAAGRNPIRVIIDGHLSIAESRKVFSSDAATIVYMAAENAVRKQRKIMRLENKGVAVVTLPSKNGRVHPRRIIHDLAKHKISSVLIEGGQSLFAEFLDAGFVDKMYLFSARKRFKSGLPLFGLVRRPFTAQIRRSHRFGHDVMDECYLNPHML